MQHLSSGSNLVRKVISVSLIANLLFFTPYSLTLSVRQTHAEDLATTTTSDSGDGGEGGVSGDAGKGGTGGDGGTGGATGDETSTSSDNSWGGDGGNGGAPSTATTSISTGDSLTHTDVANEVNTSSVTLGSASSTGGTTTASTTESDTGSTPSGLDVSVQNESTTTASTTIDLENATGDNAASSTGNVVVKSGDAISNANLLNVLNTNLVNSYGELLMLSNMFRNSVGQFDLRDLEFFFGQGGPCALCNGTISSLGVANNGEALVGSSLTANATTGGNSAYSSGGSSAVSSGNAYAAANLMNFANNNFIDSKYLFLIYNNFGDSSGDIVFPNAETLMQVLTQGNPLGANTSVSNTGTASVDTDVSLDASSGNNSFSGSSSSPVTSGNASTSASILNLINKNLLGGGSLNVLFNVSGNWSGTMYGLPPGVSWKDTGHGFVLSFDTVEEALEGPELSVSNDASTTISSTLSASASSGGNSGSGLGGSVDSGDAYASANVMNVANTNMIGRNMFWAIINIFGDWAGDLSFGQPDLWIGGHADMDGATVAPGGEITYHFTVINNGDLTANGVTVKIDLGSANLSDTSSASQIVSTVLGSIAPKESKSFDITARASSDLSQKEMATTRAEATSIEHDGNNADNTEEVAVVLGRARSSRSNRTKNILAAATFATTTAETASSTLPAELAQTLTSDVSIRTPGTADFSVVIYNPNDTPIYNATYRERLVDTNGKLIHGEVWDLGTINPHEELRLTYSVFFKTGTPQGLYTNTGFVSATVSFDAASAPVTSNTVATSVTILPTPVKLQTPLASPLETASATSAEDDVTISTSTIMSSADNPPPLSESSELASASGFRNLLASALFGVPSAKELTTATVILMLLTVGLIVLRRRFSSV